MVGSASVGSVRFATLAETRALPSLRDLLAAVRRHDGHHGLTGFQAVRADGALVTVDVGPRGGTKVRPVRWGSA